MYQALYRKWRPRSFDDVVGQEHITETLKRQVETDRLSHAYLFTGTRGTGKTTCAKLLARVVNCEYPEEGSPCNKCHACVGVENGSILDVLELDAASNNRVDDVRAILDEASYTPAAVKKRVYIVDEVHMLSAQAFNALLQILEEPPEHLMFILATTEIHKVPATIKSRCQQFSFKRIRTDSIAARLRYVARKEDLPLTDEGAALIARLADGGMRDALSLLDQCIGENAVIGEGEILSALGLAGNVDTVNLLTAVAAGDVESALIQLDRLYSAGKEMAALLGELASLVRDLLIRKTVPISGASLMTGGFDDSALKELSAAMSTARLVQMLTVLQRTAAELTRSANRRTDVELCLISLCDPALDTSPSALVARLDALEERLEGREGIAPLEGRIEVPSKPTLEFDQGSRPTHTLPSTEVEPSSADDSPPWAWEEETEPVWAERVSGSSKVTASESISVPVAKQRGNRKDWNALCARLEKVLTVADYCFIGNPSMVTGSLEENMVTLWADTEMVRGLIDKPDIIAAVSDTARDMLGCPVRTVVKVGRAPAAGDLEVEEGVDALETFLAESWGLGNVTVTD